MTSKLTDMQLVLLATACQRADGSLLPPPAILGTQGGRIRRAVAALIKRLLATECDIAETAKAWREEGERHIGVVITAAGRAIIAADEPEVAPAPEVSPEALPEAGEDAHEEDVTPMIAEPLTQPEPAADLTRGITKQALVLGMLRQEGGAALDELVAATGWLPHTTRAALTGLRKKGHAISLVGERGAARYQLAAA